MTGGEVIFSNSQATYTEAFKLQYPGASLNDNNIRFTVVLNVGQYLHYDLSDKFGLYTGLAIRNIGMITDENLPQTVSLNNTSVLYSQQKIVRRQYTLGVPLAFKIGSFGRNLYFFAGGEYEMAFHFKEKYWTGNYNRSGHKTKTTDWFSDRTTAFLPSVFGGFQFPAGLSLKFKYYLTDFLNTEYKGDGNSVEGAVFDVSDQSRYAKSPLFYLAICWQFQTGDVIKSK